MKLQREGRTSMGSTVGKAMEHLCYKLLWFHNRNLTRAEVSSIEIGEFSGLWGQSQQGMSFCPNQGDGHDLFSWGADPVMDG